MAAAGCYNAAVLLCHNLLLTASLMTASLMTVSLTAVSLLEGRLIDPRHRHCHRSQPTNQQLLRSSVSALQSTSHEMARGRKGTGKKAGRPRRASKLVTSLAGSSNAASTSHETGATVVEQFTDVAGAVPSTAAIATQAIRKRKTGSSVWKVFEDLASLKDDDPRQVKDTARCKLCKDGHPKKNLPYHPRIVKDGEKKGTGATTNLQTHCETYHPAEWRLLLSGSTLEEAVEAAAKEKEKRGPMDLFFKRKDSAIDEGALKEMWVRWIVECDLPFRTVERASFRKWTAHVCPSILTWSRHTALPGGAALS